MQKKARLLFYSIVVSLLAMAGFGINRFIIEKDYMLEYKVACDTTEACFVDTCTPETIASEDCDPAPYKIIKKNTADVYKACGTDIRSCVAAQYCLPSDTTCEVILCDETTVSEDSSCSVPEEPL